MSQTQRTLPQLLDTSFFAALEPAFFIACIKDFFFFVFVFGSSSAVAGVSFSATPGTGSSTPKAPGLSLLVLTALEASSTIELEARDNVD